MIDNKRFIKILYHFSSLHIIQHVCFFYFSVVLILVLISIFTHSTVLSYFLLLVAVFS